MLAASLSGEDSSGAKNATFISAGTANIYWKTFLRIIHLNVPCVVETSRIDFFRT